MPTPNQTIIDLENKFWQSMVDHDNDTAVAMLTEPALMVSSMGAMKFSRDDYRRMADQGQWELKDYELSDMNVVFPTENTAVCTYHARQKVVERGKPGETWQEMHDSSTWVKADGQWQCVMHTETPANGKMKPS
jgi:hypothetical protein